MRSAFIAFGIALLLCSGCMSVATNTSFLSDSSHLGTPYSGARGDLHILFCFGKGVHRNASDLILAPLVLLPLIDLPLSFLLDTLLLPIDIVLEPGRSPQIIGGGGCKLIGM